MNRLRTGIDGLDDVLGGGLPERRLYLVHGSPGVGKTTLALQFLMAGVRAGETALYITLSETRDEILQVAESHGWSLDKLGVYELSSLEQALRLDEPNHLYATADVELEETVRVLLAEVDRLKPHRVVFDSLSEIRLLAQTPIRFRRQVLALKQYFAGRGSTVLLLDDLVSGVDLQSLAHGVLSLEQSPAVYGADRRTVRISKLRGSTFRTGRHDMLIHQGGIQVYPRLVAAEHRGTFGVETISTGVPELDQLLGGGIDRGGSTLLMGPAGAGKSAIAMQIACAAAERGEHVALFLFEERPGTFHARAKSLGLPVAKYIDRGFIRVQHVDPAELPPDQFTHLVRRDIESSGARVLVVDSVSGYFMAMPDHNALSLQLHELLSYTGDRGVATLLTLAQTGLVGHMGTPVDMSYMADTVVLLRYFEAHGRVRKAISAVKKRSGPHEDAIRELTLGSRGIKVGKPLVEFHGVLSGMPRYVGEPDAEPCRQSPRSP